MQIATTIIYTLITLFVARFSQTGAGIRLQVASLVKDCQVVIATRCAARVCRDGGSTHEASERNLCEPFLYS